MSNVTPIFCAPLFTTAPRRFDRQQKEPVGQQGDNPHGCLSDFLERVVNTVGTENWGDVCASHNQGGATLQLSRTGRSHSKQDHRSLPWPGDLWFWSWLVLISLGLGWSWLVLVGLG